MKIPDIRLAAPFVARLLQLPAAASATHDTRGSAIVASTTGHRGASQVDDRPKFDDSFEFSRPGVPEKLADYIDAKKVAEWISGNNQGNSPSPTFNVQMSGWSANDIDDLNLLPAMKVDTCLAT